jgi:hypothetical protein
MRVQKLRNAPGGNNMPAILAQKRQCFRRKPVGRQSRDHSLPLVLHLFGKITRRHWPAYACDAARTDCIELIGRFSSSRSHYQNPFYKLFLWPFIEDALRSPVLRLKAISFDPRPGWSSRIALEWLERSDASVVVQFAGSPIAMDVADEGATGVVACIGRIEALRCQKL